MIVGHNIFEGSLVEGALQAGGGSDVAVQYKKRNFLSKTNYSVLATSIATKAHLLSEEAHADVVPQLRAGGRQGGCHAVLH